MTSSSTRSHKEEFFSALPLPPIPRCFRCAMCDKVMTEPTRASDGLNYDRRCIESWLEDGHETSPATSAPLQSLLLYPNDGLNDAMQEYLALRDLADRDQRRRENWVAASEHRISRILARKDLQLRELKASLRETSQHLGRVDSTRPTSNPRSAGMTPRRIAAGSSASAVEVSKSFPHVGGMPRGGTISSTDSYGSESSSASPLLPAATLLFSSGPAPRGSSKNQGSDGGDPSSCSSSDTSGDTSDDGVLQRCAASGAKATPPTQRRLIRALRSGGWRQPLTAC
eukprot:CAMPEP_0115669608 /NCGR_PEP_ID=MMETSP0272-20121206/51092_1 /TAXON_ID=71861 /ORGANISM="Scrippsiella trochoidea, Strain CCMP3099" /LENGTH=283 /DNA_ID=CAMNT_0003108289 /DNA_START=266 /DNA_END=1117 /DNA_ORIENTATION=+